MIAESEERCSKRIKTEDNKENDNYAAAADVIQLLYNGSDGDYRWKPLFTHQLFENEKISYLEPGTGGCLVSVIVSPFDWTSQLCVDKTVSEENRVKILYNLRSLSSESKSNVNPPGKLLQTFTFDGTNFEMYIATHKDAGASELISQVEKVAIWFIETASSIDFCDDKWEAIFLYRDASDGVKELLGYFTLYTFNNPFVGAKMRICQALILPHLQQKGLGRRMMGAVYDLAQSRDVVVEITVEDPCEGFSRMRDAVDLSWVCGRYADSLERVKSGEISNQSLRTALKITEQQVEFVVEALNYASMLKAHGVDVDDSSGEAWRALEESQDFKEFRLRIKRRILNRDKEIKSLPKADMQRELSELFSHELRRFRSIEKAAGRFGLL